MSFPAYPAYWDSGIHWIACLPSGWRIERLKAVADVRPSGVDKHTIEGEVPVRLCNYVDVYKNDRITAGLTFMEATATPGEIERFTLAAGDVLITKDSETPADIAAAALVEPSAAGMVCGYHLALLRPQHDRIAGGFLFWSMKAPGTLAQFSVRAQGITRFGLTTSAMGDVLLALPLPAEQSAIAAFLDRETGKIDALVAEQERLIALLKEKRQAVISQAVTKGLDPNAPMKDSGVEWLGEVPAHWEARKLLTGLREPPCYGVLVPDFDEAGVPMLRITDIENGFADRSTLTTITPALSAQYSRTIVQSGDIALSVVGTIGEAIQIDPELAGVNLSRALARLQLNVGLSADFLCFVFQSRPFERFVDLTCVGTAQRVLNMSALSAFRLPFPSVDEQAAISAHLEHETRALGSLISEAERAIALLKERRAALISAAVTGKIDVRGLVPAEEVQAA